MLSRFSVSNRPSHVRIHYCNFVDCTQSFKRSTDRDRHETEKHGDPKRCPEAGCTYKTRRESRLQTHTLEKHGYKPRDRASRASFDMTIRRRSNIP